ncbi:MAG: 30S ribosomal protein S16 [Planctomyces sp.]|nr:30S ribosomal protein S16 [Planctomyces sp.]
MVRIRLTRMGRPHRPFYRVVAVDSRVKRDGKVLENLGHYDPTGTAGTAPVHINAERVKHWLGHGAKPSDTVLDLLATLNLIDAEAHKAAKAKRVGSIQSRAAKKAAATAPAADAKPEDAKG